MANIEIGLGRPTWTIGGWRECAKRTGTKPSNGVSGMDWVEHGIPMERTSLCSEQRAMWTSKSAPPWSSLAGKNHTIGVKGGDRCGWIVKQLLCRLRVYVSASGGWTTPT